MKTYTVTLELVSGYYGTIDNGNTEVLDYEQPKITRATFDVEADNEHDAIHKAKNIDKSMLSVYESYAELKEV